MIGLEVNGKPLMRAYSIASANYEEELEIFLNQSSRWSSYLYSTKVKVGDEILVSKNLQVRWFLMT